MSLLDQRSRTSSLLSGSRLSWFVGLVVLVGCSLVVLIHGLGAPLGFDESYNLQVPVHLAENGRYASNGTIVEARDGLFDPNITTGPTILAPTALAMALFGSEVWVARTVSSLAFVGLLVMAGAVGCRFAGPWGALGASFGILMISYMPTFPGSPVFGTGDVLGEPLSAALVLAAGLAFRRPTVTGVLLGLAVLTKLVALLYVPAFLLALMLNSKLRGTAAVGRLISGLSLPLALWQLIRVASLGLQDYGVRTREFLDVFSTRGSGLAGTSVDMAAAARAHAAIDLLQPPLLLLLAASAVGFCWSWYVRLSRAPAHPMGWTSRGSSSGESALAVGSATLALWWLLIADAPFVRHLLIAAYVSLPLLAGAAVHFLSQIRASRGARLWRAGAVLAVAASVLMTMQQAATPPGRTLEEQRAAADAVRETGVESTLTVGWWQVPEIAFLSGVPSREIESGKLGDVLLLDVSWDRPRLQALARSRCGHVLYTANEYVVCRIVSTGPSG